VQACWGSGRNEIRLTASVDVVMLGSLCCVSYALEKRSSACPWHRRQQPCGVPSIGAWSSTPCRQSDQTERRAYRPEDPCATRQPSDISTPAKAISGSQLVAGRSRCAHTSPLSSRAEFSTMHILGHVPSSDSTASSALALQFGRHGSPAKTVGASSLGLRKAGDRRASSVRTADQPAR